MLKLEKFLSQLQIFYTEDIFKTSWRRLKDVLKTFLQDVLKIFLQNILKTS